MTRNMRGSLLIATMLVVAWATSSEACHRRRAACAPSPCGGYSGGGYASPTGYYGGGGGYTTANTGSYGGGGGYTTANTGSYSGGYPGGTAGYPGYPGAGGVYGGYPGAGGGYDFGRPGYNPGGLGGPASGIGVRPGLGAGGFGPGR